MQLLSIKMIWIVIINNTRGRARDRPEEPTTFKHLSTSFLVNKEREKIQSARTFTLSERLWNFSSNEWRRNTFVSERNVCTHNLALFIRIRSPLISLQMGRNANTRRKQKGEIAACTYSALPSSDTAALPARPSSVWRFFPAVCLAPSKLFSTLISLMQLQPKKKIKSRGTKENAIKSLPRHSSSDVRIIRFSYPSREQTFERVTYDSTK